MPCDPTIVNRLTVGCVKNKLVAMRSLSLKGSSSAAQSFYRAIRVSFRTFEQFDRVRISGMSSSARNIDFLNASCNERHVLANYSSVISRMRTMHYAGRNVISGISHEFYRVSIYQGPTPCNILFDLRPIPFESPYLGISIGFLGVFVSALQKMFCRV